MAKPFGDPKRVRGKIKLTFTQDDLDSIDFDSKIIQLGKDLQNSEYTVRVKFITHKQLIQIKTRLVSLKRKRYINDYYFNLEEDSENLYSGSFVMCYNKVNI